MSRTFTAGFSDWGQVCLIPHAYCFACRASEKACDSIVRRYAELAVPHAFIAKMTGIAGGSTFRLEIWSRCKLGSYLEGEPEPVDGVDQRSIFERWRMIVLDEGQSAEVLPEQSLETEQVHPFWEDLQSEMMSHHRDSTPSLAVTKMWMNSDGEAKLMRND